ncbi:MAG: quinol:cytochrome C oxidoreductase, partial [Ignavibacteriae bacterium]|nr:quinol:cytochrome C oxidoreductase [Ignavibacteriota bacterium]
MSSAANINIEYVKKDLPPFINKIGIGLTVVGLILVVLAYFTDPTRSAFNNIILLMFVTSIGLGSLFLVAIEYLGGAVWSTPFRRIAEILASTLLVVPILAIPIYFNLHGVYHWTHADVVATDELLSHKSGYLNETFFTIRVIAYFAIWILFYFILTKNSQKQDVTKEQSLTKKNIRNSAIFIPFFAITVTFSSIDWMMSLEPHWFSTIFGVYYFSGTFLSALAIITFLVVYFHQKGLFPKGIVTDHYYSFGALLYGFLNFWAYIAFSQFMLIWYANLPEETFWFLNRWEGSWQIYSIALILIHFLIPFFALVSQPSKTNGSRLKFMAIWLLVAHFM